MKGNNNYFLLAIISLIFLLITFFSIFSFFSFFLFIFMILKKVIFMYAVLYIISFIHLDIILGISLDYFQYIADLKIQFRKLYGIYSIQQYKLLYIVHTKFHTEYMLKNKLQKKKQKPKCRYFHVCFSYRTILLIFNLQ